MTNDFARRTIDLETRLSHGGLVASPNQAIANPLMPSTGSPVDENMADEPFEELARRMSVSSVSSQTGEAPPPQEDGDIEMGGM